MKELSLLNGRLRDGLIFCRKAYAIYENVRGSNGGVSRLRLRKNIVEKKLIEEILPIVRYIQLRYNQGKRIKVKWMVGNQPYDAYILLSGSQVTNLNIPKKQYLEVTTAVHDNEHLAREYLNNKGYVFGIKGVSRNKNTKEIESIPHVRINREAEDDFANIIIDRIEDKSKKNYPDKTTLIIQCMFSTYFIDTEWNYIIEKVRQADIKHKFCEVVLFDSNYNYFAILM